MNPKISDFGMARIFGGDETEVNTKRVVGTYGYMPPEYAMDGVFSMKSDVFSFGVLVLEIISGKRNRGVYSSSPHMNLLGHVWSLWNEENSLNIVDETMNSDFSVDEVLKCIKIGLLCVQERPEDRPLMSWIVLMLAGDSGLRLPEPKQPGFISRLAVDSDSSSSKQDSTTVNYDISVSIIEGR
ncbi:receptor-like serine/threonine-protein kinase SD1-7 [Phalaenopsis equestris]|nr:receptor-like serine/threonine-protein kinase SD1-7 [Phalaenopsis equestris]